MRSPQGAPALWTRRQRGAETARSGISLAAATKY